MKMETTMVRAGFGDIKALVWVILSWRCLLDIEEYAFGYTCLGISRVICTGDRNLRVVGTDGG